MNSLKIPGERTNAPTAADGRTGSAGLTSIIILCYNQVEYTTACVRSILRHTREPVELIFVDNGSTDGTRNYLEDDDFCLRAIIAGFDVVIAGDVFVHHFGSITFKGARMDYAAIMQENAWIFAKKWHIELSAGGYNPLPILARRFDPVSHYFPFVSEWSSKALLAESVRLFEQGRIEASYVAVTKALELEPNNPDALHNMALIAMNQRDFRLAFEAWEKVSQTDMDFERFNLMGVCHFQAVLHAGRCPAPSKT